MTYFDAPVQSGNDLDPWDDVASTNEITETLELRKELYQRGYRPIGVFGPMAHIKKPGKQPVGHGWTDDARAGPPKATVEEPIPQALNTGIAADGLRPIDIDVDDPFLAKQVRDVALEILGQEPLERNPIMWSRIRRPRSSSRIRAV